jgi:hypothetical protein
MYKGVTIVYAVRLGIHFDDGMQKSYCGWILEEMGEDRTVLRKKKGKFLPISFGKKRLYFFIRSLFPELFLHHQLSVVELT